MANRTVRNVGGDSLRRTGKAQTEIARDAAVSRVTVHQWIAGNKRPGVPKRARLQELYGIPAKAWDEPYVPRAAATPVPPTQESVADGGAFSMARSLQRQAQAQLDELEHADEWDPVRKVRVMQGLASTINVLAKITGQYELGRRMLTLPIWKQLEHEIFEALKAFPDASKSVADRLERFEQTWLATTG